MNQIKVNKPKRQVDGILLLNKPLCLTSNAALQIVKRLYAAKKAGHAGSLDPLATGMLPICFGEATKFSQYLLDADKHYQVTAKLGERTSTGDAEGKIISQQAVPDFSAAALEKIIGSFRGQISQVPSMYSAIKHQGTPLYELARKGITVERAARVIQIYQLNLIERAANTLTLDVKCSKGTYIRTLVEDLGDALGCGAHVAMLRRLSVAGYKPEDMHSLTELEQAAAHNNYQMLDHYLLSTQAAVQHWPVLNLSEAAYFYLQRGQAIIAPYAPASGWVTLLLGERFIGVGEVLADGKVAPRRLIQTN